MNLSAEIDVLKKSAFFDADWYLKEYPDVAITGLEPAEHYLLLGAKLERNPSPYFDAKYYLEANRDIRLAGINPLLHYIQHGSKEGRAVAAVATNVKPEYQSPTTIFKIHASSSPKLPADLFNLRAKYSRENNLVVMFAKNVADFRIALKVADKFQKNLNVIALVPSVFHYDELATVDCEYKEIDVVTFSVGNQISALMRLINGDIFYSSVCCFLVNFEDNLDFSLDNKILDSINFLSKKQVHNFGLISSYYSEMQPELGESVISNSESLLKKVGSQLFSEENSAISLSLCYVNTLIIKSIRALAADPLAFSPNNQDDALNIFKTILLAMTNEGSLKVSSFAAAELLSSASPKNIRSIAFYLPQFHVTPENDKWWGKGFSEWHNVVRAKPLFQNHYQPRIPADLGFYDLSSTETQIKQAELAKHSNIDGFCYYYYWFDGQKVLNKPIENMLANKNIDMPFCICWANENWSRNWDGQNRHVLLAQSYSEETNKALIHEFIEYMKDPRYIRHDGKPVLVVYRIKIIPEWKKVARMWREECRIAGIGEIHLCSVRFGLEGLDGDPGLHSLDSYVSFPPHELKFEDHRNEVSHLVKGFGGTLYSYDAAMKSDIERFSKGYPWPIHRGVMMGWDNTARRLKDSRIFYGCTPLKFRSWLNAIKEQENLFNRSNESLLFINAWNEWAEGTTLEPDQRFGTSYLDATYSVLGSKKSNVQSIPSEQKAIVRKPISPLAKPLHFEGKRNIDEQRPNLLLCAHISGHQLFGGERSFLDVLRSLTNLNYNIVVTLPSSNNKAYIEEIKQYTTDIYVINYKQWINNREHEPHVTLAFCDLLATHAIDLVYANTIVLIEPLKAANLMGITNVVHSRELITLDAPLQERIGLSAPEIISNVFKSCDYLIANSRATQMAFARENKTFCAPNAIDVKFFPKENLLGGKIKVGIISSNIPKKGVADFLKVAQLCQDNVSIEFLVMGPDNKYTEEWKLQQQRGLLPLNIIFTGYIDTPQEAISKINLLINTSSFAESFGRTVAEAMAGCRPVIAYEWGALNELIISGETGYLAPYGDYETIAKILLEFCEKPEKIIGMGINARAHVESNYSHTVLEQNLNHALTTIFNETARNKKSRVSTTIVIPVYNAPIEVVQCLESLYINTALHNTRVIIINDGSTDSSINGIVESYRDKPNTTVYHNEMNIGYTKTVNRGISLADHDSDIILLNSDTRLTPFWLEGLRATAYKSENIGTVTAMSDNAGAFSFPLMNQANRVPSHFTEAEYANLILGSTFDCEAVEVPTGSGFCFYIKRTLTNSIGKFDEVLFPRGYGEENDFCMRAIDAGFKNVITPWSYVYHARTASFKGEKTKLVEEGVSQVIAKFPHYPAEVKKAFNGEKIGALRKAFMNE
jgi:GT2 family glycosyltransferase/glycosyltransferase involved in cell wall biosynthesis